MKVRVLLDHPTQNISADLACNKFATAKKQHRRLRLYRISAPAPAGIWHFFQIRQKSGSGKNPTGAG